MYRMLLCHRRKRGVPRREFHRHWRGDRARLVSELQDPLGFSRCGQIHQTPRWNPLYLGVRASRSRPVTALLAVTRGLPVSWPGRGGAIRREERWDVVESLTYPSRQALVDAVTSPPGRDAAHRLREDHAPHVSRTAVVVAEQLEVGPTRGPVFPRLGTMFFLRSPSGMTREEMLAYWESSHRELVVSLHPSLRYSAYNQLHVRSLPESPDIEESFGDSGGDPYDGVAELAYGSQWELAWRSLNPFAQVANVRLVRDEVGFIDGRRSTLVFGEQIRFEPGWVSKTVPAPVNSMRF